MVALGADTVTVLAFLPLEVEALHTIILCGGMGTRLREHTETRPKPMVEVGGQPMLWHIMKLYAAHGFSDFTLALGYKGDVIRQYFLNYRAMRSPAFRVDLGRVAAPEILQEAAELEDWRVTLVETGEAAMTGARVWRAAQHIPKGETFAVTYGDGVSDVDLASALAFHRAHGGLATVTGVRPPSRFGELQTDGTRVRVFSEKPQVHSGMINGGFFLFEPAVLEYLSDEDGCVLERAPLERLADDGQLHVYEHGGYWQCMDTFRDWQRLEAEWKTGKAPWRVWK